MICPSCKSEINDERKFCKYCGAMVQGQAPVPMPELCIKCGDQLLPGENFCANCGASATAQTVQAPVAAVNVAAPSGVPTHNAATPYIPPTVERHPAAERTRRTVKPDRKRVGRLGTILSLVLAVVLGLGGYLGAAGVAGISDSDSEAAPFSSGAETIAAGYIPTDAQGNNLIGNLPYNLHNGGLMAMQGDDVFYANPVDNGNLYCADRGGSVTKLTDFAVANLNVRGNVLIFTDLAACSYSENPENGNTVYLSASTHMELWEATGEDVHIQYGGNLHIISGIRDFCAGELPLDELVVAELDSGYYYQSPVLTETGGIMAVTLEKPAALGTAPTFSSQLDMSAALVPLIAAPGGLSGALRPASVVTSWEQGKKYVDIPNTSGPPKKYEIPIRERVRSSVTINGHSVVATHDELDGGSKITIFDKQGNPMKTTEGHSVQTDGKNLFFMSEGIVYEYDIGANKLEQVSAYKSDRPYYEVLPDGSVKYSVLDKETDTLLHFTAARNPSYENRFASKIMGEVINNRFVYVDPSGKFKYTMEFPYGITRTDYGDFYDPNGVWFSSEMSHNMTQWNTHDHAYTGDKYVFDTNTFGELVNGSEKEPGEGGGQPTAGEPPQPREETSKAESSRAESSQPQSSRPESSQAQSSRSESSQPAREMNLGPDQCLNLVFAMFQGGDFSDSRISSVLTQEEYNLLLKEYNILSSSELLTLNSDATRDLQGILGDFGTISPDQVQRLTGAILGMIKQFKYTVGAVSINGDSATVEVTVSQRVEVSEMRLLEIFTAELQAYPGGPQGLVALGEQGVLNWLLDKMIEVLGDPARYGILSTTPKTVTISMVRKPSGAWVTANTEALSGAMFIFK